VRGGDEALKSSFKRNKKEIKMLEFLSKKKRRSS
jgi:hypothetical protein